MGQWSPDVGVKILPFSLCDGNIWFVPNTIVNSVQSLNMLMQIFYYKFT